MMNAKVQRVIGSSLAKISFVAATLFALSACSTNAVQPSQNAINKSREVCKVASLEAHNANTLLGVGYYAIQDNDLVCAERTLVAARALAPNDPYVMLNLGVVYERTGRKALARQSYQQVIDSRTNGVLPAGSHEASVDGAKGTSPTIIARQNLTSMK